jgi:hypothetical protein
MAACFLFLWDSSPCSAQTPPPAATTWAIKVLPGSRCEQSPTFAATLAAQIPPPQRASEVAAELVANVFIHERVAHIGVFDRVLQAEAGARELPIAASACPDVAAAVALVIAVMVEAGRGSLQTVQPAPGPIAPPAQPAQPPPEAKPNPPPAREPPPPRSRRARTRHIWLGPRAGHDVSLAAGLGMGLLPGVAPGATLGWGVRPAKTWPFWFQASGFSTKESADGRARFAAVYGGVLTCPLHVERRRVRLRACAGFAVGALWAEGRELAQTRKNRQVLALPGLELGLHVRLVGPLEFTVLARGDGSLYRPRFVYYRADTSTPTLHQPSVIVGSAFAGLALRFR